MTSVVPLLLVAAACAQTKMYTPDLSPVPVKLDRLPANKVQVEVHDLRAESDDQGALRDLIARQVQAALAAPDTSTSTQRFTLTIDILEHGSFFTLGNWNATTRLRARLVASDGTIRGQWDASGSGRRSNMFGYETARAVGQDSYNAAIADLLSALGGASLR
jgi:hypothetical protein